MYQAKVYKETWKGIKQRKTLSTTLNVVWKANIATPSLLQEFRGLPACKTNWESQLSSQKYSTDQFSQHSSSIISGSTKQWQALENPLDLPHLQQRRLQERRYELCHQHTTVHVPQMASGFLTKGGHIFQQNSSHYETWPENTGQIMRQQFNICIIHNLQPNEIYRVPQTDKLQGNVSLESAVWVMIRASGDSSLSPPHLGAPSILREILCWTTAEEMNLTQLIQSKCNVSTDYLFLFFKTESHTFYCFSDSLQSVHLFETHYLLSPFYPRNVFWTVGQKWGGWFKIPSIINMYGLHNGKFPICLLEQVESLLAGFLEAILWLLSPYLINQLH